MKIVTIVRTLNESANVNRFIYSYRWVDKILVADGGSTDDTVNKLNVYKDVYVRAFDKKIEFEDGSFANPRGEHINFLIDWAKEEEADWIIFDDFDCVPTASLQEDAREIFNSDYESFFAYRMFILGQDKWFPKMSPAQSLWAWKSSVDVRADEDSYTISMVIPESNKCDLDYPYALLHYFYPDEEVFLRKKAQYIKTGEVNEKYDPKSQFGNLQLLPEWAKWT